MTRQFARLPAILSLALTVAACGGTGQPSPTATATQAALSLPSPTALIARPATPMPTAAATATTQAVRSLVVGNTGGDGVFVRKAPGSPERLKAWPDGTAMIVIGADRQLDGKAWKNVKDPEGNEGWVAADYLVVPTPSAVATPAR